MTPARPRMRATCVDRLLRDSCFLLTPLLSLPAELTDRQQGGLCRTQPAMPRIVGGRGVDGHAIDCDHPVVVRGDPKSQRQALVARSGLDIHLATDALKGSGHGGLLGRGYDGKVG